MKLEEEFLKLSLLSAKISAFKTNSQPLNNYSSEKVFKVVNRNSNHE